MDEKYTIGISSLRELLQEAERGLTDTRVRCKGKGLINRYGITNLAISLVYTDFQSVYGLKKDYAPQFEHSLQGALVQGTALIAAVFFDFWDIENLGRAHVL